MANKASTSSKRPQSYCAESDRMAIGLQPSPQIDKSAEEPEPTEQGVDLDPKDGSTDSVVTRTTVHRAMERWHPTRSRPKAPALKPAVRLAR